MSKRTLIAPAVVAASVVSASALIAAPSAGAAGTGAATICSAVPADLELTVNTPIGAALVSSAGTDELSLGLSGPSTTALRAPDGTWWISTAVAFTDDIDDLFRIAPDGSEPITVASGQLRLTDTGWMWGQSAAVYLDYDNELSDDGKPDTSSSKVLELSDGSLHSFGPAQEYEYAANSLTLGSGFVAEGSFQDLGEGFEFYVPNSDVTADFANPASNSVYDAARSGCGRRSTPRPRTPTPRRC